MRPAQRARELVRAAYAGSKPVMGSSDDTTTGHGSAVAHAKLIAISQVLGWADTTEKIEAIRIIIGMREMDL